jgi:hypothetical protein
MAHETLTPEEQDLLHVAAGKFGLAALARLLGVSRGALSGALAGGGRHGTVLAIRFALSDLVGSKQPATDPERIGDILARSLPQLRSGRRES